MILIKNAIYFCNMIFYQFQIISNFKALIVSENFPTFYENANKTDSIFLSCAAFHIPSS